MNNTQEIWVDVSGFEPFYEISTLGRIRSKPRMKRIRGGGLQPIPARLITAQLLKNGYFYVTLWSGKTKGTTTPLHRVIAKAFIPNPENKPEVNHLNGIRTDNSIENLEWCTTRENALHKYRVLGYKCPTTLKGTANKAAKLNDDKVRQILTLAGSVSMAGIAQRFSVSKRAVQFIIHRKTWKHVNA